MVVSSNYNLIPYPDHHYPIQPFISENALANQDPGQESIERHNRFRQPHSNIKAAPSHFDMPDSRYDFSQGLQYTDADHLGRLLDIYA